MPLRAACALAENLTLYPRDDVLEQEALKQIAAWSTQFTSLVSLSFPQAVLLEVGGSLSMFGSADKLLNEIRDGLGELGYQVMVAIAPTPLAALWLARADRVEIVEQTALLASMLGDLPLSHLRLGEKQLRSLEGMGLQFLADLVRLPRDGLTRRLGKDLVLLLDRALGRAPDPQKPYVPPHRFRSRLLLPAEADNVEALLFAMRRMLAELGGMLLGCGGGVQELSIQLIHRDEQADRDEKDVTHIDLRLSALSRDPEHLVVVLRERLERVTLEAPVIEIGMAADTILPLASHPRDLFAGKGEGEQDWQSLLERLRARLGEEAVHGLRQVAEHRPERAWNSAAVGDSGRNTRTPVFATRPLWLLDEPVPLVTNDEGRPRFHGSLQLDPDRERIESGWWDGDDVARDYFVARNTRGLRLWVYRELRDQRRWYLHGIFG